MARIKTENRKLHMQRGLRLALSVAAAALCLGVVTCLASDQSQQDEVKAPPVSFEVHKEEALIIDPERSGAKTGLPLEVFGLQAGEELQCLVGELPFECKITEQKDGGPAHVQLELSHDLLAPGEHAIELVQGKHAHTRRSAIYIVHRPQLDGTSCDDQGTELGLPAGQPRELSVAPHSGANLKVLLAGAELQTELKEAGRLLIQVPATIPPDARLKLVEEAGSFGPIPLCERRVRNLPDTFSLDSVTLTYDRVQLQVQARLRGTGLPDVVTATHSGMDRPITLHAGDDGQERIYSSDAVAQSFDQFLSFELSSDGEVFHQVRGRWLANNPDLWSFQELQSELEFELERIIEDQGSGEVELGGKVFSFGRIEPRQVYAIGLSEEQNRDPRLAQFNLAAPSSHLSGVLSLELREGFLMSLYEATNSQFLAYARQSGLPAANLPETLRPYLQEDLTPELAQLPVTGVSFVDVQGYVAWLQAGLAEKTSRWQVRLPHELEWEMAARGDRAGDYAFKDQEWENGLLTLEKTGPRPVGANPMDQSPLGIRDMTGNVREWTNTVYNEQMLDYLAVYMTSSLTDGWDPTRLTSLPGVFEELPEDLSKTSRKMTVRGGANGESPVRLLVSLRRQMEMAEAAEDVGFRLVLVPRKGP